MKPAPKADCKFCNAKVGTSVRRRGVIFQGKYLHVVRSIPKICTSELLSGTSAITQELQLATHGRMRYDWHQELRA